MTDKQIIIDGVDVSGCECYSEHREGYCGWHTPCEGDICPYKLKWAQQQLDQLKARCKSLEEISDILQKQNHELINEIELIEIYRSITPLNVKKLVQTLTEIKDIVKNMNEECFYGDFKCEDCDFKNGCTYQAKKQLKQKISEVIKNE